MEEQGISKVCEIKNTSNAPKYRNLSENATEKFGNISSNCEKKVHCPKKCADEVEKNCEKEEIMPSPECMPSPQCFTTAPADECNPPLDTWTRLSGLTGTRPTVGNFTIARYSPAECAENQWNLMDNSKHQVREANNLDYKTKLLEEQIYSQTDKQQFDNNLQLIGRAGAIFHWKTELEFINKEIASEIEKIQNEIKRLLKAFQAVEVIKNMDNDIQKIRNMRMSTDLVHDNLAEEIIKEETLCKDILNVYTRCIDETKMQLTELKNAKQRLEHDWSDKEQAYDVDTSCIGLKNTSEVLQWKPGCAQLTQDQSTPQTHEFFVKETIIYAKTALNRSELLRANMKETTNKSVKELRKQAASVEIALADQINKHLEACRNLENSLQDCLKRLADNEALINRANEAVRRLDGPMKCAQTRLVLRLSRENVENCRDDSQFGLVDEVKNISEGVTALSGQVKSAEESMDSITKLRKRLENDIIIKRKSLWVDRERCRLMRSFYPSTNALSGY